MDDRWLLVLILALIASVSLNVVLVKFAARRIFRYWTN